MRRAGVAPLRKGSVEAIDGVDLLLVLLAELDDPESVCNVLQIIARFLVKNVGGSEVFCKQDGANIIFGALTQKQGLFVCTGLVPAIIDFAVATAATSSRRSGPSAWSSSTAPTRSRRAVFSASSARAPTRRCDF